VADLDRDPGGVLARTWNALAWLRNRLSNPQRIARAVVVGERHYDIGNDLYARMLDRELSILGVAPDAIDPRRLETTLANFKLESNLNEGYQRLLRKQENVARLCLSHAEFISRMKGVAAS
jgi:hypothetical protein